MKTKELGLPRSGKYDDVMKTAAELYAELLSRYNESDEACESVKLEKAEAEKE